jgi:hypothetical protein
MGSWQRDWNAKNLNVEMKTKEVQRQNKVKENVSKGMNGLEAMIQTVLEANSLNVHITNRLLLIS